MSQPSPTPPEPPASPSHITHIEQLDVAEAEVLWRFMCEMFSERIRFALFNALIKTGLEVARGAVPTTPVLYDSLAVLTSYEQIQWIASTGIYERMSLTRLQILAPHLKVVALCAQLLPESDVAWVGITRRPWIPSLAVIDALHPPQRG